MIILIQRGSLPLDANHKLHIICIPYHAALYLRSPFPKKVEKTTVNDKKNVFFSAPLLAYTNS